MKAVLRSKLLLFAILLFAGPLQAQWSPWRNSESRYGKYSQMVKGDSTAQQVYMMNWLNGLAMDSTMQDIYTRLAITNVKIDSLISDLKIARERADSIAATNTQLLTESQLRTARNTADSLNYVAIKTRLDSLTADLATTKGYVDGLEAKNDSLKTKLASIINELVGGKSYGRIAALSGTTVDTTKGSLFSYWFDASYYATVTTGDTVYASSDPTFPVTNRIVLTATTPYLYTGKLFKSTIPNFYIKRKAGAATISVQIYKRGF